MTGVAVDFNAVRANGDLRVARRRAAYLRVGEVVNSYDEDGNEMRAAVRMIDDENGLVYLTPDWATWTPAEGLSAPHLVTPAPGAVHDAEG